MENLTPWALCGSIFCVMPLISFAAGFWFGRYGVEIKMKNPEGNLLARFGKKRKGQYAVDEG